MTNLGRRAGPQNGPLTDQRITDVVLKSGTPAYIYSLRALRTRAKRVEKSFTAFRIMYAVKANPSPVIVREFVRRGTGLDIGTMAELKLAIAAGAKIGSMVFGGPGKDDASVEYCMRRGILLDLDSLGELERAERIARKLGRQVQVSARLNVPWAPKKAGEIMSGGPSQFGIDAGTFVREWRGLNPRRVALVGMHAHVASQVLESRALVAHVTHFGKLCVELSRRLGVMLRSINFGGGIGIPYQLGEQELMPEDLGSSLSIAARKVKEDLNQDVELQLELGRYLVGPTGYYICRIRDIKRSRGRWFVIVDSGISGFSRPAMPWAQRHPCWVVGRRKSRDRRRFKIVGSSCLPTDVLDPGVHLAMGVRVGDLLAFGSAGAYGRSMSMLEWANLKRPVEVFTT